MLGKIVFLIWDRKLLEKAAQRKRDMGAEGRNVHIWGRHVREDGELEKEGEGSRIGELEEKGLDFDGRDGDGEDGDKVKSVTGTACGESGKPRCLEEYESDSTLFVTDKGAILQELKRTGRYVIALLEGENGQEDFSGAPYAVTDLAELSLDSFDKAYRRMAGMPWTVLETERCVIRETTVADVDEFYRIYAEPSITYYMDRLYDNPEEERAYAEEYIRKVYGFYGYGMWSIVRKDNGRVIGRAGLSWREGFDLPEIGFVIEVPCQRMGYAYEVCSAIVEYGMGELEFGGIQALVEPGNAASMGLCRKLGMEWKETVESGGKMYERFVIYTVS